MPNPTTSLPKTSTILLTITNVSDIRIKNSRKFRVIEYVGNDGTIDFFVLNEGFYQANTTKITPELLLKNNEMPFIRFLSSNFIL